MFCHWILKTVSGLVLLLPALHQMIKTVHGANLLQPSQSQEFLKILNMVNLFTWKLIWVESKFMEMAKGFS